MGSARHVPKPGRNDMNVQHALGFLFFLSASTSAGAAITTTVLDLATPTTTQRFLYVRPDAPRATLVVLAGGNGDFGIGSDGTLGSIEGQCNPVARTRLAYANANVAVALVG